jgi:hypothetical protein
MRTPLALLMLLLAGCQLAPRAAGPTPVPEPPEVTLLAGRGLEVTGHGTSQTDPIVPPYIGIDVVTLTHDGHSTFVVSAVHENQTEETLTTAVGTYQGQRPLVVEGATAFRVTADGNWKLELQPVPNGATANFQGAGDAVSGYFMPPAPATWSVTHDGRSGFYVYAHCLGGSTLVAQADGALQTATPITFQRGPCFWEVKADGSWSLQPGS